MTLTLIEVRTAGPGSHEITGRIGDWLTGIGAADGILTAFVRHTSCSLLVQENADPDVQRDLLVWLDRVVPPATDPAMAFLTHTLEGPDDMPAHLKAALLPVSLSIPVERGRLLLGRWQGVFLVEHRRAPHRREVALAFQPL